MQLRLSSTSCVADDSFKLWSFCLNFRNSGINLSYPVYVLLEIEQDFVRLGQRLYQLHVLMDPKSLKFFTSIM